MDIKGRRGMVAVSMLAVALGGCGGGGQDEMANGPTPPQPWPQATAARSGDPGLQASLPVAPAQGGAALPPMPPPLDTRLGQQVSIMDQAGFGQPVVAATVAIPAGWQSGGGITWNTGTSCFSNQMQVNWSAIGPDSLTAIAIMSGFNWQVQGSQNPENPCPIAPFRSTQEFLDATAQKLRPGVRILGYEKRPDLEQKAAAAQQQGMQGVRHDGGQMMIGYEQDGVPMEEALIAVTGFTMNAGGVMGSVGTFYAVRAPKGRLDLGLTQRVADTMQPNPQYMAAVRQRGMDGIGHWARERSQAISDWHNREMAMINARGNADRHAIRMRGNQETASIYNAIAANTSATTDRMHATTMSGVGEYDRYAGVDGTEVQNSIHNGPRVFQNTSDPSQAIRPSEPYVNAPGGYQELEPQP